MKGHNSHLKASHCNECMKICRIEKKLQNIFLDKSTLKALHSQIYYECMCQSSPAAAWNSPSLCCCTPRLNSLCFSILWFLEKYNYHDFISEANKEESANWAFFFFGNTTTTGKKILWTKFKLYQTFTLKIVVCLLFLFFFIRTSVPKFEAIITNIFCIAEKNRRDINKNARDSPS